MMTKAIGLALLASSIAVSGCQAQQRNGNRGKPETTVPAKTIDQVLAVHRDSLMALPGVVGTAIGLCQGERCIKVFLADSTSKSKIPSMLDGYPVVAEVTGRIQPR